MVILTLNFGKFWVQSRNEWIEWMREVKMSDGMMEESSWKIFLNNPPWFFMRQKLKKKHGGWFECESSGPRVSQCLKKSNYKTTNYYIIQTQNKTSLTFPIVQYLKSKIFYILSYFFFFLKKKAFWFWFWFFYFCLFVVLIYKFEWIV